MKYALFTFAALPGIAFGQTIINGSFDGGTQPTRDWAPTGWTKLSSPDYSFGTSRQFGSRTEAGTPSPDGGGYMGMRHVANKPSEGITGEMTGLEPNKSYTLSYYYTAGDFPNANPSNTSSPDIVFMSGNTTLAHTPEVTGYDSPNRPWSQHSFTFAATGTAMPLTIKSLSPKSTWGFIDGLTLEVVTVPEPSSTAFLGLGSLALILRRKK